MCQFANSYTYNKLQRKQTRRLLVQPSPLKKLLKRFVYTTRLQIGSFRIYSQTFSTFVHKAKSIFGKRVLSTGS